MGPEISEKEHVYRQIVMVRLRGVAAWRRMLEGELSPIERRVLIERGESIAARDPINASPAVWHYRAWLARQRVTR